MAIIPQAAPKVPQISSLAQVRNTTEVRPATGMAAAVGSVVDAGVQIVEQERERADLTAIMQARRELSDHELALFDPANEAGVYSYKGKTALEAGRKIGADFDRHSADIAAKLTPRQRQQFEQVALSTRESVLGRVQTYAGSEYENWQKADRKASLLGVVATGVTAALDGDDATGKARLAEALTMQQMADASDGASVEVQRFNARALASDYHAQVLESLVNSDYARAEDYLSAHRDALLPEQRTRIEQVLRPLAEDGEADTIATAIVHGGNLPTGPDGAPAARSAMDPVSVQNDFRALSDQHGFEITSMKRPPLKIGAGARSQHPKGTAADFSVAGKSRAQINALIAAGKQAGFEVIDESDGTTGTGPHIHMELPSSASRGGAAVAHAPAATLGEAIERTKSITDPRKRKAVEQHVRSQWAVMEADRVDRERTALESMRAKIGASDGSQPLRKVLGADEYALAERQGWLGSLNGEINAKRENKLIQTNPITYDRFARMAVTDPTAFAKPETKKQIELAAHELDTADLGRLQGLWSDLNDPKKRDGKLADWATDNERVESGLRQLGYGAERGKPEKNEAERANFRLFYQQARTAFVQKYTKEPSPAEADALLRDVVRRVATRPDVLRQAAVAERYSGQLSEDDRATVIQVLKQRGIANPTEAQIVAAAGNYYAKGQP